MNKIIPLASFGDSYVDRKGPKMDSWHDQLVHLRGLDINQCHNIAQHGASTWWGVYNFKRLLEQGYTIENAVFSFTSSCRMPIAYHEPDLSDTDAVSSSYEYNMYCSMTPEEQQYFSNQRNDNYGGYSNEQVFGVWDTVMENNPGLGGTRHLVHYVNKWMICEVYDLCKQHNVNATFIIPFNDHVERYLTNRDYITRDYLVVSNLDAVSHREKRHNPYDPESDCMHPLRFVKWYGDPLEGRCNHLSGANNKILADLINQGLSGRTGLVDFETLDLDYDDVLNYAEFEPNPDYRPQ